MNNNFNIDRSTIGVLNTGSIANLNSSVTALNQGGNAPLAAAFKSLTEAVANEATIAPVDKDKILEMMSVLAAESTVPAEKRKKFAMLPLLKEIATFIAGIGTVGKIWDTCRPIIESVFQ